MCGRFTITVEPVELIDLFNLDFFPGDYQPNFNIAPTQQVITAVQTESGRKAGFIKWGLVPYWVQTPKQWKPLINARAETLNEKSSFKNLVHKRRCIIFADSFYEWKKVDNKKQPFRIMRKDEKPFALAGLWDRNQQEKDLITCTIITTEANELVQNVHDRMPVILDSDETIELWLNTKEYSFKDTESILQPLASDQMKLYEVSPIVNSPKNNCLECIQPIAVN